MSTGNSWPEQRDITMAQWMAENSPINQVYSQPYPDLSARAAVQVTDYDVARMETQFGMSVDPSLAVTWLLDQAESKVSNDTTDATCDEHMAEGDVLCDECIDEVTPWPIDWPEIAECPTHDRKFVVGNGCPECHVCASNT